MKVTADTNVLVRALTGDDARQSPIACDVLAKADLVALPLPVLCELVWVLSQGYGVSSAEIALAIRRLIDSENAVVDRPAAEAGLNILDRGGDFADGIIAHEGEWLGAETFVSFDKKGCETHARSRNAGEGFGLERYPPKDVIPGERSGEPAPARRG